MSPVPQEPKSASSTTARPDNESSVDNVAQAATALEANLTSLENRLDALLAAFEAAEESQKETDSVATVQDHKPKRDNTAAAHHGTSSENKVQDGTGSNTAGVTKRP
nr:uncharacterized protein CTRU02_09424 [Colletotrichum truncatum]KAF6788616.1 hypothetical protein CTRU02_09424 [Colletotrichum truncatum]